MKKIKSSKQQDKSAIDLFDEEQVREQRRKRRKNEYFRKYHDAEEDDRIPYRRRNGEMDLDDDEVN